MAQKEFLVTGATGATGGHVVERLLERGHAVRAVAHREDDRSKRLVKMGVEVLIGDLLNFNDVRTTLSEGTRQIRVILYAKEPSYGTSSVNTWPKTGPLQAYRPVGTR